jgi:hypothetical protein
MKALSIYLVNFGKDKQSLSYGKGVFSRSHGRVLMIGKN